MRKARGYLITYDPRYPLPHEIDTFTCLHCQQVVDKPPYKQPTDEVNGVLLGGYCHKCNGPICPQCIGKPCTPAEWLCEMVEQGRHYDDLLGRK